MNEQQMTALAVLATDKEMDWVIKEYARDVTAVERAEKEAHERAISDSYREECRLLNEWVWERLPNFAQRVGLMNIDYWRTQDNPPFYPRLLVRIGAREIRVYRDWTHPASDLVLFEYGARSSRVTMLFETPDQNWANFVIAIATVTGALERAEVPAPGEGWGQ